MQPLFAEAPDAARRECHQFVVWRVISDFPPPFKNGGTDIVDPLIGHRADQLRKPKLPTSENSMTRSGSMASPSIISHLASCTPT